MKQHTVKPAPTGPRPQAPGHGGHPMLRAHQQTMSRIHRHPSGGRSPLTPRRQRHHHC
jgi:hypothetical protein